jgi:hypothetical protein
MQISTSGLIKYNVTKDSFCERLRVCLTTEWQRFLRLSHFGETIFARCRCIYTSVKETNSNFYNVYLDDDTWQFQDTNSRFKTVFECTKEGKFFIWTSQNNTNLINSLDQIS